MSGKLEGQSPENVVKALVYLIANDLERSIAGLGYPVGCGSAPHPDTCAQAAQRIVDKISDAALAILATRAPPESGADDRPNGSDAGNSGMPS